MKSTAIAATPTAELHQAQALHVLLLENASHRYECMEPFLRRYRDIKIVGVTFDASMAIRLARLHPPAVIVANLRRRVDLEQVVRNLRQRVPGARLLVVMENGEPSMIRNLCHAGADEVLIGTARPASVIDAIRQLAPVQQRH